MITSRPLEVYINSTCFWTYYVDYLCVHKQHRKKTIAPQLIQTHEYFQRHLNKNIQDHPEFIRAILTLFAIPEHFSRVFLLHTLHHRAFLYIKDRQRVHSWIFWEATMSHLDSFYLLHPPAPR